MSSIGMSPDLSGPGVGGIVPSNPAENSIPATAPAIYFYFAKQLCFYWAERRTARFLRDAIRKFETYAKLTERFENRGRSQ
ncbi:MAG TPA: hypothetical protein VF285_05050 [Castellaniella sp.]|uniref:hypothetical protein n=1 Tax=Castellaniella sp. TaxID=1955812 RepID=UPI002EDC1560